uniref:NADH dehydrogenase subunit 2 n=1 Tax=Ernothrips longitudinalis TaxID=3045428 RepID=UPI0030E336CC
MKSSFYLQKNLFFFSLISSITICFSCNSFIMMWMSMEINLFSFIPLISIEQKKMSEKSSMMYFLIQSISSSIFLIAFSMNLNNMKSIMSIFLILSIFMKLGLFPFHFWMISAIEGMSWNTAFLLMTIQKIIPITILSFLVKQNFIILFCLLNSLMASISGMTMFSTRKILGFSSINHLSLMLISMLLSKKIFKIYFLVYSFMTLTATKTMKSTKINFLFQTMTNFKENKINNLSILIIFMSMAGIPPFLGFMPKMMTIMIMMKSEMHLTTLLILIFNTLAMFFYMRMTMNNILMNLNLTKMKQSKKKIKFPLFLLTSPAYLLLL